MAEIFISYRRKDSEWAAGRLGDRLEAEFGKDAVFLDTIKIPLGEDFSDVIGAKVEASAVLLAVIGEHWLSQLNEKEENGEPDYLRVELVEALKRGIRIIPLYVDGARMPGAKFLPDQLKALATRNGMDIHATSFRSDTAFLIEELRRFRVEQKIPFDKAANATVAPDADDGTSNNLRLEYRTEYDRVLLGLTYHRVFVRLATQDQVALSNVERVTYFLGESFKNPVREISDRDSGFELKTSVWGEILLQADVHFVDGSAPVQLSKRLTIPK